MSETGSPDRLILLTGATGFVGGRLLTALESAGHPVRCLTRNPQRLEPRIGPSTTAVAGDILDAESVRAAMEGVDTAYYLIHSLGEGATFKQRDRQAAEIFGKAAKDAGVRRIIYLGGLGSGPDLSEHLASRHEVGRVLAESGVDTIEFRASIIIGSGSLSFEMIRALVGRLPIMVTPRWALRRAQPIAIEDVIAYLVQAVEAPIDGSRVFEIGGKDRASYVDIMQEYARQRGLSRYIVPVPVLTPHLSSLWLTLVTPLNSRVGRMLIDSIRNDTTVSDTSALEVFDVQPRTLSESIKRALANEDRQFAETRWSDALSTGRPKSPYGGIRQGSRFVDSRNARVDVPPSQAFEPIRTIGGKRGWYYGNWLWRVRGRFDQVIGGVGLRRGRRDPEQVLIGETLDFWRVEAYEPDRLLRLYAEMKVPGRAWLQFEVEPDGQHGSTIRQTAIFDPVGLSGSAYWYGLYPIHSLMFAGMLRSIVERARNNARAAQLSQPRTVAAK